MSKSSPRINTPCPTSANYLPEYGKHMIEATPGTPYGNLPSHLVCVERNMRYRRKTVEKLLNPNGNERLLTITSFPLMGLPHTTSSLYDTPDDMKYPNPDNGLVTRSVYIPDDVISPHPRFATLTRNIRLRRGKKVDIRVPLYQDINTVEHINEDVQRHPYLLHESVPRDIDHTKTIHMDAMGFGMGMCCLQTTFQASKVTEARRVYDQLAVFAPIMMALTAATPFFRGRIADIDTRWTVISQAVDCRTDEERGVKRPKVHIDNCRCKAGNGNDAENSEYHRPIDTSYATACKDTKFAICPPHVVMLPTFDPVKCENESSVRTPDVRCSATPSIEEIIREDELYSKSTAKCCIPENKDNLPYTFYRTTRVFKSRYDSVSSYLCDDAELFKHEYNDLPLEINGESYKTLLSNGIDELLARHIAHLFIRDPLAIYSDRLNLKDDETTEMFENLQSTNWQSVRFKPPPIVPEQNVGWRVEFRTMEVQLTDWENAAFTVFASLLSRAILTYNINLYLPISKVDYNMRRAHDNDANIKQRFYWRCDHHNNEDARYREMSVEEIMVGTDKSHNCGLITIVRRYLNENNVDDATRHIIDPYFDFLTQRANGELLTAAQWLRHFVYNHPLYQYDSIIRPEIGHDIIELCHGVTKGRISAPDLLGQFNSLATQHEFKPQIELKVKDACSVNQVHQYLVQQSLHNRKQQSYQNGK